MPRMRAAHGLLLAAAAAIPGVAAPAASGSPLAPLPGEKDDAAATAAFDKAWRAAGDDGAARAAAVASLDKAPPEVAVKILLGRVLPNDDFAAVQSASVKVLAGHAASDAAALKAIVECAQAKGPWVPRSVAIEALGRSGAEGAPAALRRVLKETDGKAIAAALFALSGIKPAPGAADLKALAGHSAWQVRLGVYACLAAGKDPASLPLLVDRLEEESGRLLHECADALVAVSGKDYGTDAVRWRAYAAGGEDAVKAHAAAEAAKREAEAAKAGGNRAVATGPETVQDTPTYYGLKIVSDRVVFIVDLSLSMNAEMVVDRDTMIRETGAVVSGTGAGETPDTKKDDVQGLEWWKIRTRVDFAKAQMKYVVSTLKKDQWFDIVWFSDSVQAWMGQMVPATPHNKAKAAAWIEELKCEAGTNTWGGLTKGLNLVGKGGEEENYRRGADTLYFMSDGEPSKGDIVDKGQIVAALERIHKVRRVKVNVVQIGTSILPFMEDLARVTGGKFKFFNAKAPEKKQ
jgi:hypothetical protein